MNVLYEHIHAIFDVQKPKLKLFLIVLLLIESFLIVLWFLFLKS